MTTTPTPATPEPKAAGGNPPQVSTAATRNLTNNEIVYLAVLNKGGQR